MSRNIKTSSGDTTASNSYSNLPVGENNHRPVFTTSYIEREETKGGVALWSQVWMFNPDGTLYITWDSRVGDIHVNR